METPPSSALSSTLSDARIIEELVAAERIRSLYALTRVVLIASIVNATFIAIGAFRHGFGTTSLVWWGAVVGLSLWRFGEARQFQLLAAADHVQWERRYAVAAGISGVVWGVGGGLLFVPGALTYQLLLVFVLGGMAAGAAMATSLSRAAFTIYLIPSLTPLIVRLSLEGDPIHFMMASMLSVFGVAAMILGRFNRQRMIEALHFRFTNSQLAEKLTVAKAELEEANASLEERVEERTAELRVESEERAQVERELHQAQRVEAIGKLTTGIAHDFNNLLTVVRTSFEMLRDYADDPAITRQAIRAGLLASSRGAQLTRSLLAFARTGESEPSMVDVDTLMRNMLQSLVRRVLPENIDLRYECADPPWSVFVDPRLLESALLNVIVNARDAMPGGGRMSIDVSNVVVTDKVGDREQSVTGDCVRIQVRDSGLGIPDAHAYHEGASQASGGTGRSRNGMLGLSMVFTVVRDSGGWLHVDSIVAVGTTVSLLLPRAVGDVDEDLIPSSASVDRTSVDPNDITILVVEDEPSVRNLVVRMLEKRGCRIHVASSGDQALELLERLDDVDVVFSDIVMPGSVDGLRLARTVREKYPEIGMILTTGYSAELEQEKSGTWLVLNKPYSVEDLFSAIRQVLHLASGELGR